MKGKARILIVDDDPQILDMLKCILEDEGYVVNTVANGNSAMAVLTEQKPDLVLLDISLPDLNGYQVLSLIRERSEIPVIMLTGIHEVISVRQSVSLGADDYVRKPFRPRELLARIKSKLRRARSEFRIYR